MTVSNLASTVLNPLKDIDSVVAALNWMQEFKLDHVPVVNDETFLGILSEDALIEERSDSKVLGELLSSQSMIYVAPDAHLYEAISVSNKFRLSLIPVVDKDFNYRGFITRESLIEAAAKMFSLDTNGAIIVLEISNLNNSLAYISQIVESENAQILSSYVQDFPESTKLELTLKINRLDVSSIVAAFLRYNYNVIGVFGSGSNQADSNDRFNSLMNYLNV